MSDQCTNCGAPKSHNTPDARRGVCAYCGVDYTIAIDAAQLAAGMQLDMRNAEAFMMQLARALGHAFGPRSKIDWAGGRIAKVALDLGKDMFVAVLEVDTIIGQKKKMVRGVALKTAIYPIEEWVPMLHEAIAEHMNTNTRVATALAQLRIG